MCSYSSSFQFQSESNFVDWRHCDAQVVVNHVGIWLVNFRLTSLFNLEIFLRPGDYYDIKVTS